MSSKTLEEIYEYTAEEEIILSVYKKVDFERKKRLFDEIKKRSTFLKEKLEEIRPNKNAKHFEIIEWIRGTLLTKVYSLILNAELPSSSSFKTNNIHQALGILENLSFYTEEPLGSPNTLFSNVHFLEHEAMQIRDLLRKYRY